MRRFVRRAVVAALLVLPAGVIAAPASAAPADLTCPMAVQATAVPGVGLVPEPQVGTGTISLGTSVSPLTPCSSPLTGTPYTGASGPATGTGTLGCVDLGNGLSGTVTATATLTWNNGDTSTVAIDATFVYFIPVVTVTVTSGALQGSTVIVAPVPVGLTGNCLLAPLTGLSFAGVAEFLHL
jgi:hypothetical protein